MKITSYPLDGCVPDVERPRIVGEGRTEET